MNDSIPARRARRYLSLALWVAVLMAPSLPVAVGLLAGGAALRFAPTLWRAALRRHGRGGVSRLRQPGGVSRLRQCGDGRDEVQTTVLGKDPARRPVTLSDAQLAAHALILGASGAGKSTTMLTIVSAQIRAGRPVVAIDMKGSPAFAAELRRVAEGCGRGLSVWTPDGSGHWNPLQHGNATSLKDKLIRTERFSEPHYQRAAERYVQTALQVLQAAHPSRPVELHEVVAVMEPRRLIPALRLVPEPLAERVHDYLGALTPDQVSAVRGLGTRLALLSESSAGPYLRTEEAGAPAAGEPGLRLTGRLGADLPGRAASAGVIDLRAGLEGGEVMLFSLNSSVYGSLAAQLGALAIQDLVSASGHRLGPSPSRESGPPSATVAIDEFSALGADNVLALLARGRESGVSVILATQEMSDLERAGRGFRDQVLGIVGVKIAHRQDVPTSAEMIAQMAGTERVWEQTENLRGPFAPRGGSRGTRRLAERYAVHPNEIKTLAPGAAVVLTKLPTAEVRRVRVTPPRREPSPPARAHVPRVRAVAPPRDAARRSASPGGDRPDAGGRRRSGARGRDRDQPAPGVTR